MQSAKVRKRDGEDKKARQEEHRISKKKSVREDTAGSTADPRSTLQKAQCSERGKRGRSRRTASRKGKSVGSISRREFAAEEQGKNSEILASVKASEKKKKTGAKGGMCGMTASTERKEGNNPRTRRAERRNRMDIGSSGDNLKGREKFWDTGRSYDAP